jgi:hypothetical protein
MVTPTSIPLLLRALHLPSPADIAIRSATADALIETVTKGMPPADKLALLTVLDVGTVLGRLIDIGREAGATTASDEVELFREKLAKVLNGVGTELCKICDDVRASLSSCSAQTRRRGGSCADGRSLALSGSVQPTAAPEARLAATNMTTSLLPLLLRHLGGRVWIRERDSVRLQEGEEARGGTQRVCDRAERGDDDDARET